MGLGQDAAHVVAGQRLQFDTPNGAFTSLRTLRRTRGMFPRRQGSALVPTMAAALKINPSNDHARAIGMIRDERAFPGSP